MGDAHTQPVPVTKDNDELQTLTQTTKTLIFRNLGNCRGSYTLYEKLAQGDMTTQLFLDKLAPALTSLT